MRSGAPAITPGVSAQAGNAQCLMPYASRSVCRIVQVLIILIRHPVGIKLETHIAHPVLYYLAPGIRIVIVGRQDLVFQDLI